VSEGRLFSSANELQQQSADFLRLLLLYPMSSTINQISTAPFGTGDCLHPLKCARVLVDAPIAFAGNETGRHIDGSVRKHFKLRVVFAARASVPLQATLKSGPTKFGGVHGQFFVGKPFAYSDLLRGRHFLCDGLRHPPVKIHDLVGRHFCQFTGRECGELERLVCFQSALLTW